MDDRKNSRRGAAVAVAVLAAVIVAAWFACPAVSGDAGEGAEDRSASAQGGGRWDNPALSSVTVSDPDGYPIAMDVLADGKVTVVNVWATWCPYCIDEMRDFQALYDKYGDKVQFVMLDSAEDAREIAEARDYVEEQRFTFPVYYDAGRELQQFFSVAAYPTTIVIDSNGEVLSNKPGRIVASSFDDTLAGLIG